MNKYIRLEDAIRHALMGTDIVNEQPVINGRRRCTDIKRHLQEAPSIDIVRCSECKHWKCQGYEDGYGWCQHHQSENRYDDFCSYGIRSEKPNNSKERSSECI